MEKKGYALEQAAQESGRVAISLRDIWMWCLGTRLSGGLRSVK